MKLFAAITLLLTAGPSLLHAVEYNLTEGVVVFLTPELLSELGAPDHPLAPNNLADIDVFDYAKKYRPELICAQNTTCNGPPIDDETGKAPLNLLQWICMNSAPVLVLLATLLLGHYWYRSAYHERALLNRVRKNVAQLARDMTDKVNPMSAEGRKAYGNLYAFHHHKAPDPRRQFREDFDTGRKVGWTQRPGFRFAMLLHRLHNTSFARWFVQHVPLIGRCIDPIAFPSTFRHKMHMREMQELRRYVKNKNKANIILDGS